jgi:hypothetical protein
MKNVIVVFMIVVSIFIFTGSSCGKKTSTNSSKSLLTENAAEKIAENTCIKDGETLGAGSYNEGTKTWWFDANLNSTQEGCSPACVVDDVTKMAELNWRCTGGEPTTSAIPSETSNYTKQCDWVDKSDIIITVKIADDVTKDTSYEAGFYFGENYLDAKLAREVCNYRTGFNYSELKGKGEAQIGVRGYADSLRRQIVGDPINVSFDADGKPSIGSNIEVTISN